MDKRCYFLIIVIAACSASAHSPLVRHEDGVGGAGLVGRPCDHGAFRCDGLQLLECFNGALAIAKECVTACDPTFGCDHEIEETGGAPVVVPTCKVPPDGLSATPDCTERAAPDSFEPEIQWTWTGPGDERLSIVTPLVANLTDDNGDGEIDLCDTPDVIVIASPSLGSSSATGHIYVLDGLTGTLHFKIPYAVDHTVTPAIGDIDGDGLPEIVAAQVSGQLIAFEHDGTLHWKGENLWYEAYAGAIALADVDNDGDVEIIAGNTLIDHLGTELWRRSGAGRWSASAAADLDGDGDLEIVVGKAAYHHDGTTYYDNTGLAAGYPAIANLDDDPEPEILLTNALGLTVIEHNGTIKYQDLRPTGVGAGGNSWLRPATIHDFDGDGFAEYAHSSASAYALYDRHGVIQWQAAVADASGIAAGTAFDFLGDGKAEAMYADEQFMYIFDENGGVLLKIPRASGTLTEYPVVADIDNDGSAEIVVVSNTYPGSPPSPTVQVIRDIKDRWIQARRIWNQHTYHVTNVREDGTIPQFEKPSWKGLNTFRTNAQIETGGVCDPPVPK